MKKTEHIFAWLTLALAFGVVAYVGFYTLYPFKIVEIDQPIKILNKEVMRGEEVMLSAKWCKFAEYPTNTTAQIVDGIIYTIASDVQGTSPVGCFDKIYPYTIPEKLPSGEYRIRITTNHIIHPVLRVERVQVETEEFIVR
jgi:hypothetical protein